MGLAPDPAYLSVSPTNHVTEIYNLRKHQEKQHHKPEHERRHCHLLDLPIEDGKLVAAD